IGTDPAGMGGGEPVGAGALPSKHIDLPCVFRSSSFCKNAGLICRICDILGLPSIRGSNNSVRDLKPSHSRRKLAPISDRSARTSNTGEPVGPLDMLIGAHTRAKGLIGVTNNARQFRRLPGVRVENWMDEGGSPA